MNAKLTLQTYRPGGQDAHDPQFRKVLEQASRDPELARWLANERAVDFYIAAKLQAAINPPPGLLSELLALTLCRLREAAASPNRPNPQATVAPPPNTQLSFGGRDLFPLWGGATRCSSA